ncbi:hypothetical protein NESM_000398000 [Novymonas esmeraldas]|uniref:Uncharacterized protein n=1 Tax=Novymonas esmeraldas TaxID=1808958 RepID=A0AAW0EN44_9TRYP
MLSQVSLVSSSTTTLPPSNVYSSVRFRTPGSSTVALPAQAAESTLFSSVPPRPPRRRVAAAQDPEDVIASRYLQQLGNALICGASKGARGLVEEATEDDNGGGGRIGSRRISSMRRRPGPRTGLSAASLTTPSAPADVLHDGEAASTAANRRWRQRVAPIGAGGNGDLAFPGISMVDTPTTTTLPPVLPPSTDLAHTTSGEEFSMTSRSHRSPAPGSAQSQQQRRRRGGGNTSGAVRATMSGSPGERSARPHTRDRGKADQHTVHGIIRLSRPTSRPGSTCGSSVASLDESEWGSPHSPLPAVRQVGRKATAGEMATAEANSIVAKAAGLMASAAPPRRKLRSDHERMAQVLAQEHSKLLLLVGRRANVEADIEDLLELADAARERAQQERLNALAAPSAPAASVSVTSDAGTAAAPSAALTCPPSQEKGDGGGAAGRAAAPAATAASVAPSLDPAVVRRQLRKLSNTLLRNGGADLDAGQLRRLVDQLEDQLDIVEGVLEEEIGEPAGGGGGRAVTAAAATGARDPAPPRGRTLRQQVESAKRLQEDILESSSNFTRMEWLLESVDVELLTDMEQPPFAESRDRSATEAHTGDGHVGHRPRVEDDGRTGALARYPVRRSISDEPSHLTSPASATAREVAQAELDTRALHRGSLATTISEPSMVPFALTEVLANRNMSGAGAATTAAAVSLSARQQLQPPPRSGQKHMSIAASASAAPAQRLNLLGFMSEVLAQYELEHQDATAPPRGQSAQSPSMRLDDQLTSPFANRGRRGERGDGEAGDGEGSTVVAVPGLAGGSGRQRYSGGSSSASGQQRQPSSNASGIAAGVAGGVGRAQALVVDGVSDARRSSTDASPRRLSLRGSENVLLGAQLRNLRDGLLHDLHELYSLHDYVHLIEARRHELMDGVGKGDAEYAAEMEQKLVGHRLQLEAAQRAREAAARRNTDAEALAHQWGQAASKPRTGSGKRPVASAGSQRTMVIDDGAAERLGGSAGPASRHASSATPGATTRPASKKLSTADSLLAARSPRGSAVSEEPAAATPVAETELLRECLADTGLVFTVVGVGAGGDADTAAAEKPSKKKKKGGRSGAAGDAAERYLYYELRVALPLVAPTAEDGAATTTPPTSAGAAASSVAAVVQVAARRLMNLKLTAAPGVTMMEVAKGSLVTATVTPGSGPRSLVTMTPAKPTKAVSYAQAFTFGAAESSPSGAAQQSSHDAWEVGSTASAIFALPTGDGERGHGGGSRTSSLDSRNLRQAAQTSAGAAAATLDSRGGDSASKAVRKEGAAGRKKAKGSPAAAALPPPVRTAPASPGAASVDGGRAPSATPPAAAGDGEVAPVSGSRGASASPTSPAVGTAATFAGQDAADGSSPDAAAAADGLQLSYASLKMGATLSTAVTQLPASPPLSTTPRPVDEWGVPHTHAEMEAVERNAIVLTVLQAGDGMAAVPAEPQSPLTAEEVAVVAAFRAASAGSRSGRLGSSVSAVEQLLAALPDSAILCAMEEQRISSAAAAASNGEDVGGSGGAAVSLSATAESAVDALAAEILRQLMAEGVVAGEDGVEGSLRGASARSGGGGGGTPGSARPTSAALLAAVIAGSRHSSAAAQDRQRSAGSHSSPHGGSGVGGAAQLDGEPRSSSSPTAPPPAQTTTTAADGEPPGAARMPDGRVAMDGAAPPAALVSKTVRPPAMKPGSMPAPSLTITSSHSRPLRATEVEHYDGGLIRFDCPSDGEEATAAPPPPPPATKPRLPARAPRKEKPRRGPAAGKAPRGASADTTGSPATTSPAGTGFAGGDVAESAPPPPPVVVVERTAGSSKPHMLLPREATATLLGPSLRDPGRERPGGAGHEAPLGRPSLEAPGASHDDADGVSPPVPKLPTAAVAANSVLPTTGVAAAAAADADTVSHVQRFLRAVMSDAAGHGATGGGPVTAAGGRPLYQSGRGGGGSGGSGGGGGGSALRTELDQLQEEARELFMLDPVRYDTVISELMGQAARTLQQDFTKDALLPSRASVVPPPPTTDVAAALTPLTGACTVGDGGTSFTTPTTTAPPSSALDRPGRASLVVPSMLVQFAAPAEDGSDGAAAAAGVGLHVSQMYLSSVIPHKRGSHVDDRLGASRVSVAGTLSSQAVSTLQQQQQQQRSSRATLASIGPDGSDQALSSAASPRSAQPGARRRDTHTHVMKDGAMEAEAAARRRASRGDAAAEVERILYEQMKAQLLLRAIIAKMKELWQTKQQHAEAKHRERLAHRRQLFMQRALAAAWPLERQRVIHLHKLIYLLDRHVGRVHGWLPHYSDTNVLMGGFSGAAAPSTASHPTTAAQGTLASWYRQREHVAQDAAQDAAGGAAVHACPRYLHYLPQRRMYRYMRLAKERRMLPLRLVRADVYQSHNRHLLLGYEKVALEGEDGDAAVAPAGSWAEGWPQRRLPRRRRGQPNDTAAPFRADRYEDMQTRGERLRHLRRLQRTAAFQGVSKAYAPRTRQDADLPFSLH